MVRRSRTVQRVLLYALSLVLFTAAGTLGAGGDQKTLVVGVGESQVIVVQKLERVAVADPNIADVLVVSADEVIVNGKKAGLTSLHLWEGGQRRSFLVKVETDVEVLASQVAEAIADPAVRVRVIKGTVFLEGTVGTREAAARAEKIARAYTDKVANLLQVPPAPPVAPPVSAPPAAESKPAEAPRPPSIDRAELPAKVEEAIGLSTVKAKLLGDTLLLDGTVSDQKEADRAVEIATALGAGAVTKVTSALVVVPVEPPQVLLQVQVTEVSADGLNQLGIAWGTDKPVQEGGFFPGETWVGELAVDGPFGRLTPLTGRLDMMLKDGSAKLLAAPSILTRSGKQADFLAGGELPVVIQDKDGSKVYWKEYGIKLAMAPEVRPGGRILVHLKPEVSTLDWANGARMNNGLLPALKTRRAETDVLLRDGGTLVIGGLLNSEDAKNTQGLPFLSKLPIIGHLFASKGFQTGKTQLVIFVTPHLISEGESPRAEDVVSPPVREVE